MSDLSRADAPDELSRVEDGARIEGLEGDFSGRVAERRRDSFFHEFRGTGAAQTLLGMGELIIPVLALLSFEDVAADLGLGLLGSLGLILFFVLASFRRVFRRRATRIGLQKSGADEVDLADEVEDHWTDFFRAAALLLVLWAMIPTTRYVLSIDDFINSGVFILSDLLVGSAAAVSAFEGWLRRRQHLRLELEAEGLLVGDGSDSA